MIGWGLSPCDSKAGVNEVRLSAEKAWGPDIDFMKVQPADAN